MVARFPRKKVKLAADEDEGDDDDDAEEEVEEKAPVKKSVRDTPAKNAQKSNQNGKDSKPSTPRSKVSGNVHTDASFIEVVRFYCSHKIW